MPKIDWSFISKSLFVLFTTIATTAIASIVTKTEASLIIIFASGAFGLVLLVFVQFVWDRLNKSMTYLKAKVTQFSKRFSRPMFEYGVKFDDYGLLYLTIKSNKANKHSHLQLNFHKLVVVSNTDHEQSSIDYS